MATTGALLEVPIPRSRLICGADHLKVFLSKIHISLFRMNKINAPYEQG